MVAWSHLATKRFQDLHQRRSIEIFPVAGRKRRSRSFQKCAGSLWLRLEKGLPGAEGEELVGERLLQNKGFPFVDENILHFILVLVAQI